MRFNQIHYVALLYAIVVLNTDGRSRRR